MGTTSAITLCILCLVHSACCRIVDFGGLPNTYHIPSISGGPFISRIEDLYGGTIKCPDKCKASLSAHANGTDRAGLEGERTAYGPLWGDAYIAYYKSRVIGRGGIAGAGENKYRSQYQSPKPTDQVGPDLPGIITYEFYETSGSGEDEDSDFNETPGSGENADRDFYETSGSGEDAERDLYETLESGDANRAFYDLAATQGKAEKTPFLRRNYTDDETKVDTVANSQSETVLANQLYGYQPYLDPVYQYIYPVFLGTCLGVTLILVVVLIKQFQTASGMSRASISILLAIAVTDALTTVFGLSEMCYRFSETSGNPGFLPYRSCNTMFIIGHLSGVVHEASVWLTVVLTTQRFICVSRPFFARHRINLRVSLISIAAIFVVIVSFHIYRFFDRSFVKVLLQQSNILDEENFETCDLVYAPWIENPAKYESIFLWLLIALMQFLPCIIIATFVSLIVKTLIKKKTNLVTSETARSQRAQITIIVIVIAIIAVSVELSSGIFLSLCVWGTTTGEFLFSYDTMKSIAVAFDLVLYVSYFVIFLIYCLMSQEVRRVIVAFCKMGRGSKAGKSSTSDFV